MPNNNYLSIYAKSFNWAGFFLPKKIYLKCSALYDFCRTVDNIADEDGDINIKKKKLLDFKNNFNNKNYDNPIIKNMWELINDFEISTKIIDERAIFKNNSSSESGSKGSSLEMQGWIWDFEPNPIDNSRESGKIIFEIIVDYYGEIIGLRTLETTLSPAIGKIYEDEILKLTFSPTNNDNPAEVSKGKITFIIKNN